MFPPPTFLLSQLFVVALWFSTVKKEKPQPDCGAHGFIIKDKNKFKDMPFALSMFRPAWQALLVPWDGTTFSTKGFNSLSFSRVYLFG